MSLDENDPPGNATAAGEPRLRLLAPPAPGVDLWWCALDASAAELHVCNTLLSDAEHARAARFGRPSLRDRYVIGRGSLRTVLARALGVPPAQVPIIRGVRGRPGLPAETTLDFNVSHTGDVALIGLVRHARIGVDVERLHRTINVAGIARKFLTERERGATANLAEDAVRRRLLTLWTCKEAMSKATGDALSAPFSMLDVALDSVPTLVGGPGVYRPQDWSLHRAAVPAQYVATVALWRAP